MIDSITQRKLQQMIDGEDIMVTGATGSFGKNFINRIVNNTNYNPRRLIIFSRDELKQSEMQSMYPENKYPMLRFFLGDIRDYERLKDALHGVKIVIHAAALKQVPALEYNPTEAIKTNVLGAINLIRACREAGVSRLLALSTDKATNPVNLYGATKLCSDKLFVAGNVLVGQGSDLRFSVVRYGNVFGSRGSIVPVFHRFRVTGAPITVTDERMTRFNITLEQAIDFVLTSLVDMRGGEIYVPKIPSYRLITVVKAICQDARIENIGRRPGEKLHEVMVPEDEAYRTVELPDRYVIEPDDCYNRRADFAKKVPENFCYSSDRNPSWNTVEEVRAMYEEWCHHMNIQKDHRPTAAVMGGPSKSHFTADDLFIHGGPSVRRKEALLPYGRQSIDERDINAVSDTLRSSFLTTGPKVAEFEDVVAQACGAKYAIAVNSGTAALHAAIFATAIGPGDEVIVPCITFASTANAAVFQGATVRVCDVLPDTLCLDVKSAERLINRNTKAIMPVDFSGQPCDMDSVNALARKHNLFVIVDASHSLGATYKSTNVGTLGDLTTFSFHPVKGITTAEGGMIMTNNERFYSRMKSFRTHGITTDARERMIKGSHFYDMESLGYNYRLSDIQCALGICQMSRLSRFISRRQEIAALYRRKLQGLPLRMLGTTAGATNAHHLFVVVFDLPKLVKNRDDIFAALRAEGIGVNVHYRPFHLHTYYNRTIATGTNRDNADKAGRNVAVGLCPVGEAAYSAMVSLPIFPEMNEQDVVDVVVAVTKVCTAYDRDTYREPSKGLSCRARL